MFLFFVKKITIIFDFKKNMTRIIFLTLFCSQIFFAQDKTSILSLQETVTISFDKTISVKSFVQEKRFVPKSKFIDDYTIRIPFNNFNEISAIKGFTTNNNTDKKTTISGIQTYDVQQADVFHSDFKFKYFVFSNVEDNSNVEYSYTNKYLEHKLLSVFDFQNEFKTDKAILKIVCDPKIEIGFKLFGDNQEKIIFSETSEKGQKVYTWQAENIVAFEPESIMCATGNYVTHLIYFIKSFENQSVKETVFGSPKDLYKWYSSLVKDINLKDKSKIIQKTNDLIKDKKTEIDKARTIFQWVQSNLNYVAFEFGMGGFIPRDAADVFDKKYGDCKDMANLINQMMQIAGIKSSLTWIGTRKKAYTYTDLPTPVTDNHMIASAIISGKRYFFDATDKYCEFGYPTQMIQDKEAMIGISDNDFVIEKVPVVAAQSNLTKIIFDLNVFENEITGNVKATVSGINKSNLLNTLSAVNSKEQDIWKNIVNETNPKLNLEITTSSRNDYTELPSASSYKLTIADWLKHLNEKVLFKPVLMFPFSDYVIDVEKRKYGVDLHSTQAFEMEYNYKIPKNYTVEFLPPSTVFENSLGKIAIQFSMKDGLLKVTQNIVVLKIDFSKKDFQSWNEFIKKINKNCNQSVVFLKQL